MVATSSRILSCDVWLMLMRNTSAPASNNFRIIALSDDTGPRVARILIRRSRLIVWAPWLAADPTRPAAFRPADSANRAFRLGQVFPEFPARAARVAHWLQSVALSTLAVRRYRLRRTRCGRSRGPGNSR